MPATGLTASPSSRRGSFGHAQGGTWTTSIGGRSCMAVALAIARSGSMKAQRAVISLISLCGATAARPGDWPRLRTEASIAWENVLVGSHG